MENESTLFALFGEVKINFQLCLFNGKSTNSAETHVSINGSFRLYLHTRSSERGHDLAVIALRMCNSHSDTLVGTTSSFLAPTSGLSFRGGRSFAMFFFVMSCAIV
jgi:hypothetical protein